MTFQEYIDRHDVRGIAKRLEDARRIHEGLGNVEDLEQTLESFWKDVLTGELADLRQRMSAHKPSSYISDTSVNGEILKAMDNLFTESVGKLDRSEADDATDLLMGRALGQLIAKERKRNWYDTYIDHLHNSGDFLADGFNEAFLKALQAHDELKIWWLNSLQSISENPDDYFSPVMDDSAKGLLENDKKRWKQESDPFSLWSYHSFLELFHYEEIQKLDLLFQLDKQEWLNAVEKLPLPYIKLQAFYRLWNEQETILELLTLAESVAEIGEWNYRQPAAQVFLTDAILDVARRPFDIVSGEKRVAINAESRERVARDYEKLVQQALPEWFKAAFSVLLDQNRGNVVAVEYLRYLIEKLMRKNQQTPGDVFIPEQAATDVLIALLSKRPDAIDLCVGRWFLREKCYKANFDDPDSDNRQREADEEELASSGFSLLLAAISIWRMRYNEEEAADGPKEDTMTAYRGLWRWYERLLLGRDPEIMELANPYTAKPIWIEQTLGLLLIKHESPRTLLEELWIKLELQRNQLVRGEHDVSRPGDASSYWLIRTAFGVLDRLASELDEADKDRMQEVWHFTFNAAHDMWLQTIEDPFRVWEALIINAMARLQKVFGQHAKEETLIHLPLFVGDAYIAMRVAWVLWKNGVVIADVASWFREAGADLKRLAVKNQYEASVRQPGRVPWDTTMDELLQALETV